MDELRTRLRWFAARHRRGHPPLAIEPASPDTARPAVERLIHRFGLDELRKKP